MCLSMRSVVHDSTGPMVRSSSLRLDARFASHISSRSQQQITVSAGLRRVAHRLKCLALGLQQELQDATLIAVLAAFVLFSATQRVQRVSLKHSNLRGGAPACTQSISRGGGKAGRDLSVSRKWWSTTSSRTSVGPVGVHEEQRRR